MGVPRPRGIRGTGARGHDTVEASAAATEESGAAERLMLPWSQLQLQRYEVEVCVRRTAGPATLLPCYRARAPTLTLRTLSLCERSASVSL